MAALFARIKVWGVNETVTSTDLNAEFNNILNNLAPAGISGASVTIPDMQEVFDPGNIGSENQPESLKEEIQALRSMIQKITGETQWYVPPGASLSTLAGATSISQNNRVNSGALNGDNFPNYLSLSAGTLNLNVLASATDLNYSINGVIYVLDEDQSKALSPAPSADNTAVIDYPSPEALISRLIGEMEGTRFYIDTVGTEIVARLGKQVAFIYTTGGEDEISVGTLRQDDGKYYIEDAFRGYYLNNSGPTQRLIPVDAETITLLRINYIFINTSGQILSSAEDPVISASEPTGPVVGSYWLDINEDKWKIYDGVEFVDANVTLIGTAVTSDTEVLGFRPQDFFKSRSSSCDLSLEFFTLQTLSTSEKGGFVSVDGKTANFAYSRPVWNLTTDKDTGVTFTEDKMAYLYLNDSLETVISDVSPYNRDYDLRGWYHPYKPWRAIASVLITYDNFLTPADNFTNRTIFNYGASASIPDSSIGVEKLRRGNGLNIGNATGGQLDFFIQEELTGGTALTQTNNQVLGNFKSSGGKLLLLLQRDNFSIGRIRIVIDGPAATVLSADIGTRIEIKPFGADDADYAILGNIIDAAAEIVDGAGSFIYPINQAMLSQLEPLKGMYTLRAVTTITRAHANSSVFLDGRIVVREI